MQKKINNPATPQPNSPMSNLPRLPSKGQKTKTFRPFLTAINATAALLLGAAALTLQAQEADITYQGPFPAMAGEAPATARAAVASGKRFDINAVVVTGDRIPVYSLENWESYENNALYEPMSEADIEAYRQHLLKDLQDQGYLFATVNVYRPSLNLGFLKLRVHVGQKGEVTVIGNRWTSAE